MYRYERSGPHRSRMWMLLLLNTSFSSVYFPFSVRKFLVSKKVLKILFFDQSCFHPTLYLPSLLQHYITPRLVNRAVVGTCYISC